MNVFESKTSIVKLGNSNYQIWKFKAEMLLARDELWDVVYEDIPEDPDANWKAKNRRAMGALALLVEDSQLTHIRQQQTAKGMWMALRDTHERSNLCSKLFLLRKLYRKRLDKDQSMREHINTLLEIVDQLRDVGEELKDSHVAALLLCSLPDSYDTLITALEARSESELTTDLVTGKLLDEADRRHESEGKKNFKEDIALKIKNKESRNYRESRTCFHCHKPGHLKKDCRLLKLQKPTVFREKRSKGESLKIACNSDDKNDNEASSSNNYYCFNVVNKPSSGGWYADSGATTHMSNDKEFFSNLKMYEKEEDVFMADKSVVKAKGIGEGFLKCKTFEHKINNIKLENVLYIPNLETSLLSVKRLTKSNYNIYFEGDYCIISHKNEIIATAELDPMLYKLNVIHEAHLARNDDHTNCVHMWHRRLGHRNPDSIKKLKANDLVTGMNIRECNKQFKCICCIKGKTTNKPYPKMSNTKSTLPFQLIHTDVCGPMRTPTIQNKRYMLTIIDDFSKYSEVYLMTTKNEAEGKLKEYIAKGINKFNRKPQFLRCDGGGEFMSKHFDKYLKEMGIQRQVTVPYCPQQNGSVERKNRSLIVMARCMLIDAGLDKNLWGEAVCTASYLQNRLVHRACEVTPYQLWNDKVPDIGHLKVFGSKAFAFIPKELNHKFGDRTVEGILLGYSEVSKGYRIKLLNSNRIIISRAVTFVEDNNGIFASEGVKQDIHEDAEPILENEDLQGIPENNEVEIDIFSRPNVKQQPTQLKEDIQLEPSLRRSDRKNKGVPADKYACVATYNSQLEPESWDEVLMLDNPEKEKWISATKEEMVALHKNKTWKLVPLPKGKRPIGCRWVFKSKEDKNTGTHKYRARLVAKGYLQKYGENFDETFAPVVKYTTVRTLLAIAVKRGMSICHLDAKSAFLQGEIDDEIFMTQPPGHVIKGKEDYVCELLKGIYGLKQSARIWNNRINEALLKMEFKRGEADTCLYSKEVEDIRTYVLVYVDDLLVCGDNKSAVDQVRNNLMKTFDMKDLGPVTSYLGIQIESTADGDLVIHQTKKIDQILHKFNMENAYGATTPMETNYLKNSHNNDSKPCNSTTYREGIGELLYLSTTCRPDLATATGILSRKVSNPRESDMNAFKRVLRYLKATINKRLVLKKNEKFDLIAFTDADWAGDLDDRKSTSGHLFLLGDSLIAWGSKKQSCVSLSSTEAEFVAAALATQETIWMRKLLKDLGYPQTKSTTIYEDNQGCIALALSEKQSARTKHIDVRSQFLKHLQDQATIKLEYCPTSSMLADIFTKPLPKPRFTELLNKINFCDVC